MSDCLFCKIVAGEIPATPVAETEGYLAFRDISPQAPTHVLAIPKRHVPSLNEADDGALLGGLVLFGIWLMQRADRRRLQPWVLNSR